MNENLTNMYLTFRLGLQTFGIEITKIREILTYPEITEIPDSKPWVKGVVNLRGAATPIIDLRIRFKTQNEPGYNDKTIVIATKVNETRFIGYVVDAISDIESVNTDELMPASGAGVIDARFLRGYIKKEGRMIVIIDTDKILSETEMSFIEQTA